MSGYSDGRGYSFPLSEDKAAEIAKEGELSQVGYEEETDSYGPIWFDGDDMKDEGLRFQYSMYGPALVGPIPNKSRRVAVCHITAPIGNMKVKIGGLFVNITKTREVYTHWLAGKYGSDNYLEFAFKDKQIAMAPLVALGFFQWIKENGAAKDVVAWIGEHTDAPSR